MRNTKTLTKPQTSSSNQRATDPSRKEQQIQLEATAQYERFKKSASLPAYYLNKTRLKKITQIYRALSTDKLHNSTKSRRSPSNTPPRYPAPFTPINLNSIEHAKHKNRLTIQRGENNAQPQTSQHPSNSAWGHLTSKLRTIGDRFQQILALRSEESFMAELDRYTEEIRKGNKKSEDVSNCLRAYGQCLARRERIKISEVKRQFSAMSQELSNFQVQIKKKAIRAMLDQRQIEKHQNTIKDLHIQLAQFKKKLTKQSRDVGSSTDDSIWEQKPNSSLIFANTEVLTITGEEGEVVPRCRCKCSSQLQRKTIQLAECLHKMQKYERRQKQLLGVLVVLRGEGVDVQRIYDDVIQGRIQVPDSEENSVLEAVTQVKNKQRKKAKQVIAAVKSTSAFDADNSIISSADGLSFNYDEKSLEEDVYTVRRQYKCKHQLAPALKQQLKLNFDILYDENLYMDEYESESEKHSNPPTI